MAAGRVLVRHHGSMQPITADLELDAASRALRYQAKPHGIPPQLAWHVHLEEVIDEVVRVLVTIINENGMMLTTPRALRFELGATYCVQCAIFPLLFRVPGGCHSELRGAAGLGWISHAIWMIGDLHCRPHHVGRGLRRGAHQGLRRNTNGLGVVWCMSAPGHNGRRSRRAECTSLFAGERAPLSSRADKLPCCQSLSS